MRQTLLGMLADGARAAGEAPAVIERRGQAYAVVSHAALRDSIAAAARGLAGAGVRGGDVVGLWLPNGLDYLAVEFAAAGLGAAVLGINTRYGVFELAHLLATSRTRLIVAPGRFLDLDFAGRLTAAVAAARAASTDLPPPMVMVFRADDIDLAAFDVGGGVARLSLDSDGGSMADAGSPEAPVNYFTTSGSTGAPKLAGHSQDAVATHAPIAAGAFDIRPGDVVQAVLPFCGVFGFTIVMAALASGATCLVDPVFDGPTVLRSMARFGVTHVFGGDDLFDRLHAAWLDEPADLPRFRRGAIAQFEGRAVPLASWARQRFGAELNGIYGSSELLAFVMSRPLHDDLAAQVKGGGRPVSERIELRIADPGTGAPCAGEGEGELQVRGYNRLIHYLGNPDATRRAITADGWYRTGDLVSDDGDGAFTFLCRNSEALRLRGFLVEPAEIEQYLMSHPGVDVARVVGVKTDRGDVPVGFVTLADKALTAESLHGFCRVGMAAFKVPARIEILDTFPVTAGTNGVKIRLEDLRRMAAERLAPAQAGP